MTLLPVQMERPFGMRLHPIEKRGAMAPIGCTTFLALDACQVKGSAQHDLTSRDPPDAGCRRVYPLRSRLLGAGAQRVGGMRFQLKEERVRR